MIPPLFSVEVFRVFVDVFGCLLLEMSFCGNCDGFDGFHALITIEWCIDGYGDGGMDAGCVSVGELGCGDSEADHVLPSCQWGLAGVL